jgi:cytidine deaminase
METKPMKSKSDLPDAVIDELIARAAEVRQRAYVPYSRYRVGAAVLTGSGKIFVGCNVENASYGLTVCAERNAVFQAVAAGEKEIRAVAVVTSNAGMPCGACRQVLTEFASAETSVIVANPRGNHRRVFSLGELLAESFGPQHLERE